MSRKFSGALLFTFAILGLTAASVFYITLPTLHPVLLNESLYRRFSSILLSLTLAFGLGFFEFRLCALSLLTFVRFFALTLTCYLQYNGITLGYLVFILYSGLEGFLFLSFCRLSCLFGNARQIHVLNKRKYTWQFISDYLFHCGICTVLLGFLSV